MAMRSGNEARLFSLFSGASLLLLAFFPLSYGTGTRAVLSVVDFSPYAYACEISDYGNSLERDAVYRATLMLPPEDPQLCTLPSIATDLDVNVTLPVRFRIPIGLMVSLGGCDIHTKIDVALRMLDEASPSLKYLIFYNNDADNTDGIVSITAPDPGSRVVIPENINSISLLSVSTSAGVNLMGLIQKYSDSIKKSPLFLMNNNEGWDLAMVVQRLMSPGNISPPPNPYGNSSPRVNGANFYWFRFILFALLIVSPCCRGAYLWWNGGGRIHFRRNEGGRIVGLQYVPPISYWFAPNGVHQDNNTQISDRLTEEQVMSLPEIVYKAPAKTESDEHEEDAGEQNEVPELDEVDIVISSGSADENIATVPQSPLDRTPSVSESLRNMDEEEVLDGGFECNITTCSICIEEFESGERLRMLPRCKHVFHTECILPWLTERQGCCPLCKSNVIDNEVSTSTGISPDNAGSGGEEPDTLAGADTTRQINESEHDQMSNSLTTTVISIRPITPATEGASTILEEDSRVGPLSVTSSRPDITPQQDFEGPYTNSTSETARIQTDENSDALDFPPPCDIDSESEDAVGAARNAKQEGNRSSN